MANTPHRYRNKLVRTISVTPVVTAAGAYQAGDAVGGLMTFTQAAHKDVGSGAIKAVILIDNDKEDDAMELHIFNQTFTPTADNAAFDPTDADLANYAGGVIITAAAASTGTHSTGYLNLTDNSVSTTQVDIPFNLVTGGTSLFAQLVTRGTPTYTAVTDITVKLVIVQD